MPKLMITQTVIFDGANSNTLTIITCCKKASSGNQLAGLICPGFESLNS